MTQVRNPETLKPCNHINPKSQRSSPAKVANPAGALEPHQPGVVRAELAQGLGFVEVLHQHAARVRAGGKREVVARTVLGQSAHT